MGGCCSICFGESSSEPLRESPDPEMRRQIQLEAAEKRRIENESRGIKNVDKVKRQQQRSEELEKREREAAKYGSNQPALKWQQD